MKKNSREIILFRAGICSLLALIIVVAQVGMSFASSEYNVNENDCRSINGVDIIPVDNTTMVLQSNDGSATLSIIEKDNIIKYQIQTDDGEVDYFVVDKENDTLFSSQTGKTVAIQEFREVGKNAQEIEGKATWPKTYKISYKKLRNVVSSTANQYTLATAIIVVAAAVANVTISTTAGVVMALISASFVTIIQGLEHPSNNKGIAVKVNRKKVTEYHGNYQWTGYKYNITKVSTY
jgi:hypothetical protein